MKRTPCVGICSTTYGDLVCRGCKRFAHEIDQWNGYASGQRVLVWERLFKLREGAFLAHAAITDDDIVLDRARAFRVADLEVLSPVNVAYEVVRRAGRASDFAALGLAPHVSAASASALYERIEQELYARSLAQYEHDFHVSAQ
jgi:predicted Fe-S protein YdhL (DUF1289 family)